MMPKPPIWLYAVLAGLVLLAGVGWWVYDHGREVERGKQATEKIEETEDARKVRDEAERDAARSSDRDLIDSVRPDPNRR